MERFEGSVSLDDVDSGTVEEALFVGTVILIDREGDQIKRQIRAAAEALNGTDPSALMDAAEALLEAFTGAVPGSTQGTSVVHQLGAAIDDLSKMGMAIQDFCQNAKSDASGVQGDFGLGGATVDGVWQAAATVCAVVVDVFKLAKLSQEQSSASHHRKKDLEKLMVGSGASLSANVVKSYSTINGVLNQSHP